MKLKNQNGFAAVEALVILIVLAALAACGYLYVHSRANTTAPTTAKTSTITTANAVNIKDTSFDMSPTATYYDCIDGVAQNQGQQWSGGVNSKTGDCEFNNTGGVTYKRPTAYSDDMIIGVQGLQFTASEVNEVRSIAQNEFKTCNDDPSVMPRVHLYAEADGKFLSLGIECGDGQREMLTLVGNSWKVLHEGSVGISCKDVTTYHIPASILVGEHDTECVTATGYNHISSLPGYENYGKQE